MWFVALAFRYAKRNVVQTGMLSLCIAVTVSIPIASRVLVDRFEQRMSRQAEAVPVVVGPRGSRFDLVLSSVFYRSPPGRTLTLDVVDQLASVKGAETVPVSTLFTARGKRLVCTGHGLYQRLNLQASKGTLPLVVGDATVGAQVAQDLKLSVGDVIASDRHELFDLSVPPPITLSIVGILERSDSAADDAVFASIETAWLIGGQTHGHVDAGELGADDILGASERAIAINPALETQTTVTPDNIGSIHGHLDREEMPITAALVFAEDAKPITIAAARFEGNDLLQAVAPRGVVTEMMQTVVRVQSVLDSIVALLAVGTGLLVILTGSLAARLRVDEFEILNSVGAPRFYRGVLLSGQFAIVAVIAAAIAVLLVGAALMGLGSLSFV